MPKKIKKNIKPTTNTLPNTNNLNRMLNWIQNHPFQFLTFVLSGSSAFAGVINKISNRTQSENRLVSCGSNLEKFVPTTSIAYAHVQALLNRDCKDANGLVPLAFTEINAFAYSTEYCILYRKPIKQCNNMPGQIDSPSSAIRRTLSPNLIGVDLVEEGYYKIVESWQEIATVGISFCVGVAIIQSGTGLGMLAHINAENILANDNYLKGIPGSSDPFMAIKKFIANGQNCNITLASGSPANLVYVKTVFESMNHRGVNIDSYSDPEWAISSDTNKVNHGAIMVKNSQSFIVKNPQDFKKLFSTIPIKEKGKPAALKLKPN